MPKEPQEAWRRTRLRTAIRASLPLLAASAIAFDGPVYAQQTDTDDPTQEDEDGPRSRFAQRHEDAPVEEVVVRGVRRSLESAQALKRFSGVIVDSVTAEDIGALPDRSVTETLQRVPGVAINRFAAGRDPDHFSVEGSGVVVRGLTYVRSEVNGRDSFTANNGRGLSFADVPPELLIGVDVFKSLSADRIRRLHRRLLADGVRPRQLSLGHELRRVRRAGQLRLFAGPLACRSFPGVQFRGTHALFFG